MSLDRAVALLALLALLCATPLQVEAQGSTVPTVPQGLTINEQINITRFTFTDCTVDTSVFLYTLLNGFSQDQTFTVVLSCTGTSDSTQSFNVPLHQVSDRMAISPQAGGVAQRACQLTAFTDVPGDGTSQQVQVASILPACGPTTGGDDDDDFNGDMRSRCSYANVVCHMGDNSWQRNALFWLGVHYIAGSFIVISVYWGAVHPLNKEKLERLREHERASIDYYEKGERERQALARQALSLGQGSFMETSAGARAGGSPSSMVMTHGGGGAMTRRTTGAYVHRG